MTNPPDPKARELIARMARPPGLARDHWERRAAEAEKERDRWRAAYDAQADTSRRQVGTIAELQKRAEEAEAQLAAALDAMSDDLKREEIAMGVRYCVGLILERWQGASDDVEKAERKVAATVADATRKIGECMTTLVAALKVVEAARPCSAYPYTQRARVIEALREFDRLSGGD